MGSKTSTWVGGTVVVSLLLALGAWFLAISPTLDSASLASTDADAAELRNEQLRAQLATLEDQYANLDQYKVELAGLRTEIPAEGELSVYMRQLDGAAETAGVTVMSVVPGTPIDVLPAAPAVVAAPATTEPTTEAPAEPNGESPADAAVAPVPTGPAVIPGFVAVPIDITVLGTVPNALTFLERIQAGSQRLLLVTVLRGTGQAQAEASAGRPATAEGDIELVITGYMYVLETPEVPAAPEAEQAAPPALPAPDPSRQSLTGA